MTSWRATRTRPLGKLLTNEEYAQRTQRRQVVSPSFRFSDDFSERDPFVAGIPPSLITIHLPGDSRDAIFDILYFQQFSDSGLSEVESNSRKLESLLAPITDFHSALENTSIIRYIPTSAESLSDPLCGQMIYHCQCVVTGKFNTQSRSSDDSLFSSIDEIIKASRFARNSSSTVCTDSNPLGAAICSIAYSLFREFLIDIEFATMIAKMAMARVPLKLTFNNESFGISSNSNVPIYLEVSPVQCKREEEISVRNDALTVEEVTRNILSQTGTIARQIIVFDQSSSLKEIGTMTIDATTGHVTGVSVYHEFTEGKYFEILTEGFSILGSSFFLSELSSIVNTRESIRRGDLWVSMGDLDSLKTRLLLIPVDGIFRRSVAGLIDKWVTSRARPCDMCLSRVPTATWPVDDNPGNRECVYPNLMAFAKCYQIFGPVISFDVCGDVQHVELAETIGQACKNQHHSFIHHRGRRLARQWHISCKFCGKPFTRDSRGEFKAISNARRSLLCPLCCGSEVPHIKTSLAVPKTFLPLPTSPFPSPRAVKTDIATVSSSAKFEI